MDQPIGNTTNLIMEAPEAVPNFIKEESIEEVPKEASSPVQEDHPTGGPDDMQVKTGPEDLASILTRPASVEVHIPACTPNQEMRMACINSTTAGNQVHPAPEDLPKEIEVFLTDQGSGETPSGKSFEDDSVDKLARCDTEDQPQDDHEDGRSTDNDYSEDESDLYDTDDETQDHSDDEKPLESEDEYEPPKAAKKGPLKKWANGKKKEKHTSTLKEKVKDLMTTNILSVANENASKFEPGIPVSDKKDKAKALAEEVAKLSVEDQPQAKKDANALIEDSKKFTPSASIVNMNWKVKGLNTLLKHHQLKAAAWMRGRERSKVEPNGGLLCDEMGLGKTLTVLTIIANENFRSHSNAPTLIIVPRSLITQWIDQISKHCEDKISKDVLQFYPGSRTGERDVVKAMQKRLIVITTYEQVCSSYPKLKPPETTMSPEELEAWREEEYTRRAGPFHKVEWRRIILDEAHSIKNKDSATSIAIRALNGKFKWAMSGTPLHNGVEELYPYLHFIFTSERMGYETFLKKYSNGLDHILETVLHRSTYSTRILGKPIVTLPGINNRVVEVELCSAEKLLYREIQDLGIAMIEGLADTKQEQSRCILAVITMLRMFVSHPLLAQRFLEAVLNERVIEALKLMAQEEGVAETPSGVIIDLILSLGDKIAPRPRPPGDFSELREIYYNYTMHLRQTQGRYYELMRKVCPRCDETVKEENAFVITSCHHLYCKDCFDLLPDQDGKIDSVTRICTSCKEPIEEAGYSEDLPKDWPKKGSPKKGSSRKRKQSRRKRNGGKFIKKRPQGLFKQQVLVKDLSDDEWDEPKEDGGDWIWRIGDCMPSAKTTAVRDLVANWVKEDEDVKIVIFVQFLKTAQLLQFMCEDEDWNYALITGKVSPTSREKQIEEFGKEKDVKILISSLRTGGVGLNLTMANKCILVDPWWNEAIQDQAYCRLYRIGQERLVEYVQVVAKGSIDSWMINLQKEKTQNIHQLLNTDSLKEILGLSGDIREQPNGGFSIFTSKRNKHLHTWARVVDSGIIDEVNSSEED